MTVRVGDPLAFIACRRGRRSRHVEFQVTAAQRLNGLMDRSQQVLTGRRVGTRSRRQLQRHGNPSLANLNALYAAECDNVLPRTGITDGSQRLHNVQRMNSIRHLSECPFR